MVTDVQPITTELLHAFIGRWGITGRNLEGAAENAGTEISGEENYEWLAGDFFVRGNWNHDFGSGSHTGTTIIGRDEYSEKLIAHNFDNLGFARHYRLETDGLRWEISGPRERAVRVFSPDGEHFKETWQVNDDGNWIPLCELEGTKAGS